MRAFAWFFGTILLAGLIGACLAYPAFELSSTFAGFAFHRVASRIAMLALVVLLVMLCRRLNLKRRRDFGYGLPRRRFLNVSLLWGAIGIATAGMGAAFLLATHLRVPAPEFIPSAGSFARIFLIGVSSGVAVALLEETVFRGVMHTAIERESGPWMAALLTAPLFAVLHFFARARIPAADVGWGSGFDLLRLSFAPLGHPALVFDSFVSWLAVGLILSLTRALTGNIAVAVGLHAGWVVVLRMLQESTTSGSSPGYSAWVGRFDGLLGYWIVPWGIAIAAALWFARSAWSSYAKGSSASSL
ncbi:MAG TPA: CPBP family intramembrane glutamic endopeptidase [Steroidobacteraceae bacterium]|jgi:membrane protease YdiL (CAAX protease family)|nr:CPBP family intramembrane glutamic endopeptidase [Steroidobacteraceae bacterium]